MRSYGTYCHLREKQTAVCGVVLCVPSLTQQKDFNLSSLLLLLLLEDPLNLSVHSDGPLLFLRQTAHTGAATELPAARHGQKALK